MTPQAAGLSSSPTVRAARPGTVRPSRRTLLVVGDSIALGATAIDGDRVVDRVDRSYVQSVASSLPSWNVAVDAFPLRTTPMVAATIADVLHKHRPDAILVATGANDADIDWRRFALTRGRVVRSRTPLNRYVDAIASITRHAASLGVRTILTDTLGCSLALRAPHLGGLVGADIRSWLDAAGGQPACDAIVRDFRGAALDAARRLGVPLVPLGSRFDLGPVAPLLAEDGTHPNQLGHERLARACLESLAEALDVQSPAGAA